MRWFEVDKKGLGKILARKGVGFVVWELVQNAWDEPGVTSVAVTLRPVPGVGRYRLVVEDDAPEGFHDLSHAWTLFADSRKKADPTRRGRFNFGDKLVLAVCDEATIITTTGAVRFDAGGRHRMRRGREAGSVFDALLRISRDQGRELALAIGRLIPPPGIVTTFNGKIVPQRVPVRTFDASLKTEQADDSGALHSAYRAATVRLFEPTDHECPYLYEMGLPVTPIKGRYHVDVGQKVPLNMDRENVPGAYLAELQAEVLNGAADLLSPDDAASEWVTEASGHWAAKPDAVERVMALRFGERRVSHDPSDPEANHRAAAAGYTVVSGGSLSADQWSRAKECEAIRPAGQVMPTPRPYQPGGRPERILPEDEWTPGIASVVAFSKRMAQLLLDRDVSVRVAVEPQVAWAANYGPDTGLCLNVGRLGYQWFETCSMEVALRLLLHELAHEHCLDHLSDAYHEAICRLGSAAVAGAIRCPADFQLLAREE